MTGENFKAFPCSLCNFGSIFTLCGLRMFNIFAVPPEVLTSEEIMLIQKHFCFQLGDGLPVSVNLTPWVNLSC